MKLSKVNIEDLNYLTNEEVNELVEAFEIEINNYLEAKREEILTLGAIIDFNIPNATDNQIISVINDVVAYNLRNELTKIFDASLICENDIIDNMVEEFVEEIFKGEKIMGDDPRNRDLFDGLFGDSYSDDNLTIDELTDDEREQNNIRIETLERMFNELEINIKKAKERGIPINERYTKDDIYIYKDLFGK